MKNILPIAFSIILFLSCSKDDTETHCNEFKLSEPNIDAPKEYNIWRDVFAIKSDTPIIIQQEKNGLDSTSIYRLQNDTSFIGFEVESTLLNQFIKINDTMEYWNKGFGRSSFLISRSEIDCLFENGIFGWEDYYAKYSNGFWSISRPGIHGNLALVEYSYHCGGLCGESSFLLLKKINGKWAIEKQGTTIVS